MRAKFNITKEELYKNYIADNKTTKEVALELNTSVATINRFLKKYEIKKDNSLRKTKISSTIQSRTSNEKELFSKRVSHGRKNKGLGQEPWNKGRHTGNSWTGRQHSEAFNSYRFY